MRKGLQKGIPFGGYSAAGWQSTANGKAHTAYALHVVHELLAVSQVLKGLRVFL